MTVLCYCTSQGCGEMGGRNLILAPKNHMPKKIKFALSIRLPMQLNMLLRISLNQSGSTSLLQLLQMMFLHFCWLLFQVAGYGVTLHKSLFPAQSISQQLTHLPIENSSMLSQADWAKSSLLWIHCHRQLIQSFSTWICQYSPTLLLFLSNIYLLNTTIPTLTSRKSSLRGHQLLP